METATATANITLDRIIKVMHEAYDFFNRRLCENKLAPVVITLHTGSQRNALGWFGPSRWQDQTDNKQLHELNISSDFLSREFHDIMETMLHEMAHVYNHQFNIKDVSGNQYHNGNFKKTAQDIFLLEVVGKHKTRGFAVTQLTEKARLLIDEFYQQLSDKEALNLYRHKEIKKPTSGGTDKKYMTLLVDESVYEAFCMIAEMQQMGKAQCFTDIVLDRLHNVKRTTKKS